MPELITLKPLLSLLLVSGLLVGFFYLLNKYKTRFLMKPDSMIGIEGQLALGHRQRLVLVSVRGRSILLAVSNDAVREISTWEGKPDETSR